MRLMKFEHFSIKKGKKPFELTQNLVYSMHRKPQAVLKAKWYAYRVLILLKELYLKTKNNEN